MKIQLTDIFDSANARVCVREEDALSALRTLLRDPQANWTCDGQREAVMATLNSDKDILSMLATGAGKTMQVVLPALLLPEEATVVILPLRSLVADYHRRLDSLSIPHEVWDTKGEEDRPFQASTNLVLVLIDQAEKQAFQTALTLYATTSGFTLRRLIFDEAHAALVAVNYRPSFQHLNELRRNVNVPLILMSGTVPPQTVPVLYRAFSLTASTLQIRTCSARPEIQFILEAGRSSMKDVLDRARDLVNHYLPLFKPQDRGLFYCENKQLLSEFTLQCPMPVYQGGSSADATTRAKLDQDRQAAYQQWISGDNQFLACTSAFSAGCDWPHVRLVILAGQPPSLLDAVQEMDRGGRDKKHCLAFILPTSSPPSYPVPQPDYGGAQALRTLLYPSTHQPSTCLRHVFTQYIDGTGVSCGDIPGAEQCSSCWAPPLNLPLTSAHHAYRAITLPAVSFLAKRDHGSIDGDGPSYDPPATVQDAAQYAKRQKATRDNRFAQEEELLRAALQQFHSQCVICLLLHTPSGRHPMHQCPSLGVHRQAYFDWKKQVKYASPRPSAEDRPMCFRCGVPQLNDHFHPQFIKNQTCEYEDIILPFLWMLFSPLGNPPLREKMNQALLALCSQFSQPLSEHKVFIRWISLRETSPSTNSIRAFLALVQCVSSLTAFVCLLIVSIDIRKPMTSSHKGSYTFTCNGFDCRHVLSVTCTCLVMLPLLPVALRHLLLD